MALDEAVGDALLIAVAELGQPKSVALRLAAWLKSLSDGEWSEDQNLQFFENVLTEIQIKDDPDAD